VSPVEQRGAPAPADSPRPEAISTRGVRNWELVLAATSVLAFSLVGVTKLIDGTPDAAAQPTPIVVVGPQVGVIVLETGEVVGPTPTTPPGLVLALPRLETTAMAPAERRLLRVYRDLPVFAAPKHIPPVTK
jgi:hypothetical protein